MIQKIGNRLSEIERIYRECMDIGKYKIKYIIDMLGLNSDEWKEDSYFMTGVYLYGRTTDWHRDKSPERMPLEMIIAAFPLSTEILVGYTDSWYKKRDQRVRENLVNDLVTREQAQILVPEPGDIYLLSGDTLHRANSNAEIGKPHLVLRAYKMSE